MDRKSDRWFTVERLWPYFVIGALVAAAKNIIGFEVVVVGLMAVILINTSSDRRS